MNNTHPKIPQSSRAANRLRGTFGWILSLTVLASCLASCVSTHTALQNLSTGLSKPDVRNRVGRPYRVQRLQGQDVWVYKFKWRAQKYTQTVVFDEGLVQKTGPLEPYPNYKKKMQEAESLDDYEANAFLYQKQKETGFRTINSITKPVPIKHPKASPQNKPQKKPKPKSS